MIFQRFRQLLVWVRRKLEEDEEVRRKEELHFKKAIERFDHIVGDIRRSRESHD